MDGLGRRGIRPGKQAVQIFGAFFLRQFLQLLPVSGIVFHLRKVYVIKNGLDIKTGAPAQDGQHALFPDLLYGLPGSFLELHNVPFLPGIHAVDQVVGNAPHLFPCHLGGTYIHAFVDLHGIGGDNGAVQPQGQFHRGIGLSAGRGARNDQ